MNVDSRVDEVRRWMRYAQEDLAGARAIVEQQWGVPRQACWLAQQAAEKAIKAALVFLQTEFPRTHDLDLLARLLPSEWQTVSEMTDLAELSEWAVEARYPGDWPEVSSEDARRALLTADGVLRAVLEELRRQGLSIVLD